ncbi:MAG: efflux RND transporter periplasmic adaptor subunit [Candidatus Delongbacteria bacterium]|nr:efflux RND transporter periplasmic adaptor subunit [Candidatus Delongbacteria bacterium]
MKAFWILILLVAGLMGSAGCNNANSSEHGPSGKKGQEREGRPDSLADAIPVQVIAPTRGDISSSLLYSSNIDAEQSVAIYPMTTGIVTRIYKDEGSIVRKGDILADLDDREAVINESKAMLNYKQLKIEFERQQSMYERHLISKEEIERLNYNLEKTRLEWDYATLMLSYTHIKSPIDGVVTQRYIKEGNKITTSQLTFSVVQNRDKIAVIYIPEQEKSAIYLRQKCAIITPDYQTDGMVKRMSPAIDPQSGTFKVTIGIRDDRNRLSVGQFINIKVIKDVHQNALLLLKEALIYDGGKVFVFTVDDQNRALRKEIKLGFDDSKQVEVLSGITSTDRVVTAGKSSLKDQAVIKIIQ